jgi:hypothetical protein
MDSRFGRVREQVNIVDGNEVFVMVTLAEL